jgi:hypothetical protein
MRQMYESLQTMAREAGRDPATLELVVRANLHQTREPLGEDRPPYYGTLDQIRADVRATEEMGAAEIFFDPTFSPDGESLSGFLRTMEDVRGLV